MGGKHEEETGQGNGFGHGVRVPARVVVIAAAELDVATILF